GEPIPENEGAGADIRSAAREEVLLLPLLYLSARAHQKGDARSPDRRDSDPVSPVISVRPSRLVLALIGGGLAVCARAHGDDRRRIRRLRAEARRLGELARTDPLTGLPNRRAFDERFASEVARARRYGHRLALALMDLDHFKRVNDDYGHTAGDELLREAALRLQRSVRAGEVVAR